MSQPHQTIRFRIILKQTARLTGGAESTASSHQLFKFVEFGGAV